ncbi:MAG: acyloxyacyl hydrolase [Alphaproteobacteria bacterium]|nr:acyloxyacyl hydrolase [Alphaproteobacteria bacterium]
MKKILQVLSILFLPASAMADSCILPESNPFMGTYQQQVAFGIGQGFDTGILLPPPVRPVPFYIATFQYSQPTTFFRVPARRSLNISETLGLNRKYGWEWQDYTIPMIYFTEDIALFRYHRIYAGLGAGAGLQAKQNKRIGSKLLFQFKLTFGYNFNEKWAMELFIQHFSNANTADENNSYAFYGLGITYNY